MEKYHPHLHLLSSYNNTGITYSVIYSAGKIRLIKSGESISSISLDDLRKFLLLVLVLHSNHPTCETSIVFEFYHFTFLTLIFQSML